MEGKFSALYCLAEDKEAPMVDVLFFSDRGVVRAPIFRRVSDGMNEKVEGMEGRIEGRVVPRKRNGVDGDHIFNKSER